MKDGSIRTNPGVNNPEIAEPIGNLDETVQVLRIRRPAAAIGDAVVFAGLPGEPFTEIGRAIKERSPFRMTFCTCLTNGSCGYFPVASAYAEGGYEARSSVFASTVADRLVKGAVALLGG